MAIINLPQPEQEAEKIRTSVCNRSIHVDGQLYRTPLNNWTNGYVIKLHFNHDNFGEFNSGAINQFSIHRALWQISSLPASQMLNLQKLFH